MQNSLPDVKEFDLEIKNTWLTVWFNSPEKRNPLTLERVKELNDICTFIEAERTIRGITLRGREGRFCAGGDLKAFNSLFQGHGNKEEITQASKQVGSLLERLQALPVFVVSAVEGAAMAGGFGLFCISDYVIADKNCKYALSETLIGLTPSQIAPFVVERIGSAAARRLMLTGETVNSLQAEKLGLIDEITDGIEEMQDAINNIVRKVNKAAPKALAATKLQISQGLSLNVEERKEYAANLFAERMLSEEGLEGISSFISKRAPNWA